MLSCIWFSHPLSWEQCIGSVITSIPFYIFLFEHEPYDLQIANYIYVILLILITNQVHLIRSSFLGLYTRKPYSTTTKDRKINRHLQNFHSTKTKTSRQGIDIRMSQSD